MRPLDEIREEKLYGTRSEMVNPSASQYYVNKGFIYQDTLPAGWWNFWWYNYTLFTLKLGPALRDIHSELESVIGKLDPDNQQQLAQTLFGTHKEDRAGMAYNSFISRVNAAKLPEYKKKILGELTPGDTAMDLFDSNYIALNTSIDNLKYIMSRIAYQPWLLGYYNAGAASSDLTHDDIDAVFKTIYGKNPPEPNMCFVNIFDNETIMCDYDPSDPSSYSYSVAGKIYPPRATTGIFGVVKLAGLTDDDKPKPDGDVAWGSIPDDGVAIVALANHVHPHAGVYLNQPNAIGTYFVEYDSDSTIVSTGMSTPGLKYTVASTYVTSKSDVIKYKDDTVAELQAFDSSADTIPDVVTALNGKIEILEDSIAQVIGQPMLLGYYNWGEADPPYASIDVVFKNIFKKDPPKPDYCVVNTYDNRLIICDYDPSNTSGYSYEFTTNVFPPESTSSQVLGVVKFGPDNVLPQKDTVSGTVGSGKLVANHDHQHGHDGVYVTYPGNAISGGKYCMLQATKDSSNNFTYTWIKEYVYSNNATKSAQGLTKMAGVNNVPLADSGTGVVGTSLISANYDHKHPLSDLYMLKTDIPQDADATYWLVLNGVWKKNYLYSPPPNDVIPGLVLVYLPGVKFYNGMSKDSRDGYEGSGEAVACGNHYHPVDPLWVKEPTTNNDYPFLTKTDTGYTWTTQGGYIPIGIPY